MSYQRPRAETPVGSPVSHRTPDRRIALGIVASLGFHSVVVGALMYLAAHTSVFVIPLIEVSEVDIAVPPPPPPPPPEPPPPPPPAVQVPEPPARVVRVQRNDPPPPPPPPPTPAAPPPLMVSEELTNDPAQGVPTGTNTHFQGGDMAANGTNTGPAYNSQPNGTPNATGTGPVVPRELTEADLSARPEVRCEGDGLSGFYPDEARDQGIASARVRLRVTTDASGRVTQVRALNDPGYGFARAAERAMMNACSTEPARDRGGRAVGFTFVYPFRFELE